MTEQQSFLIECITAELVAYVMADRRETLAQALATVYESELMEKLTDTATGLYCQSPGYVYDFLREELETKTQPDNTPHDTTTTTT